MKFVGEKLGLEFLVKYGSKAETILTKGVEASEKAALASTKEGKKSIVGTARDSLKKAGQGIKQFTKDFKFTKPLPVVLKKSGKTVMITAALCAALGVDGWTCQHKIENGEISEEEIKKAEEKLKFGLQSKEIKKEMDKMSVEDAEKQGLF
jgi:hypothetical protein